MNLKNKNDDTLNSAKKWKFNDILKSDPEIKARFEKVRKYFFLRETTYDMSSKCNIRCEGCYYFEGEKQYTDDNTNPEDWKKLMFSEKERGVTYVVLAGAEPALVPDLCQASYDVIDLGCIATNGFKKIPESVGYKLHLSVWGNDESSYKIRNAKNLLQKQIENYKGDPRAVFVYTFTRGNIEEIHEVMKVIADSDCKLTFNTFSSTADYNGELRHTSESKKQMRNAMLEILDKYPENTLYSTYNAVAHSHEKGLHEVFTCSYPRVNPSSDIGLGRSFRQYRTNLTWDRDVACCVPDTDCDDCRHYAAGSAIIPARLYRHVDNPEIFKAWLDYVDTYLAVWVMGYDKGKNLQNSIVEPPVAK